MGKTEQEHHRKAFESYYARGAKRSYRRLAEELGVSVSAVKLWAKSFAWSRRIGERDASVARDVADNTLQNTLQDTARNKKIVQMAMVKLAKAIADGRIKMQLGDLDRLIKLQSFLDGYHDGQTWDSLSPEALAQRFHYSVKGLSDDDLRRMVAEFRRLEGTSRPAIERPD